MNIKQKLSLTLIISALSILSTQASQQRDCSGDYRYPNQAPQGLKHNDVVRAGVVLCRDFGTDGRVTNDRYSIILGHDKNLNVWIPQAGKVEATHRYTTETAASELSEETGGLIKYTPSQIKDLPYVYAGSKQLFFLFNPSDSNISVTNITNSCQKAQTSNLPSSYKEIDEATAVSVPELLEVARQINNGTLGRQNSYTLHKRTQVDGNGQPVAIEIDGFYMRIFATRYNEVRTMFNTLFKTNVF